MLDDIPPAKRRHYPKFRTDRGIPEICIGMKEFDCIGMSPPLNRPHVYVNVGEADTILCPYCATRWQLQRDRLRATERGYARVA